MDSCFYENVFNCIKNPKYINGYECCSQTTKGKPRFGLMVKNGTCNKHTGLCINKYTKHDDNNTNRIEEYTREGYDDNDRSTSLPLILVLVIFGIVLINIK